MKLSMTDAEAALFRAFVTQSNGYFEFGAGGSTVYAASVVKGPVISIESDARWIAKVKEHFTPSEYTRELMLADIGPTKSWGRPSSDDRKEDFPRYHESIKSVDHRSIDLCLVDGRFRVACFCQALLALGQQAILGMHDYRDRPNYHIVEELARPIAQVKTMSFFLRRASVDDTKITQILEQFRYNYE